MRKEFMGVGMLQSKQKATGLLGTFRFYFKIFINPPGLEQTVLTPHENHPTKVGLPRDGVEQQFVGEFHFAVENL